MEGSCFYNALYYYLDNTLDKNELNQSQENFNKQKRNKDW